MIDINQPVKQGHDFVLNNADGSQELGSSAEFVARRDAGMLSGVHTDAQVMPHNEPNFGPVPEVSEEEVELPEEPKAKKAK